MSTYEPTLQILLLLLGGVGLVGLLVVLFSNMKISKKVAIVVTAITLITIASYLVPPEPKGTMWLDIFKVEYEPVHYFVLDEGMELYPLFRSGLDEMKAEGRGYASVEITFEEQEKIIGAGYPTYFKYEGNFYEYSIVV